MIRGQIYLLPLSPDGKPFGSQDGDKTLGQADQGTRFLSHHMGRCCSIREKQSDPHSMEVEETVNYVILAFCVFTQIGKAESAILFRIDGKTLSAKVLFRSIDLRFAAFLDWRL